VHSWKKADGAIEYKLYQRKIPDEWDKAKVIKISDPNQTKHVADDLEPTSTYQYRITVVTAEGESEPSPETTIDTAVGNCTPKPKCVIM